MKYAKNILLTICFAGLALAQNKNTAARTAPVEPSKPAAGPVTIPKDAVEIETGLFQAKDDMGKVWHYTRTPFGVRRFEPQVQADTTAEDAARLIVAGEEKGVVRFQRKTPFGLTSWSRKKDQLNAAEKMALERVALTRKESGGGASATATAKPSK
jgi:hypothetical protein